MSKCTLKDAYEHYQGPLSYEAFRRVCERFNQKAVDALLEGQRIELPARLGYLQIIRIPRSFKRPKVNWGASHKLKAQLQAEGKPLWDEESQTGHKWIVYYTDEWYCRFYWSKKHCQVRNKSVYRFVPTRGKVGAKTKLKRLLADEELAHLKFAEADHV